jgi:hypothetical protein
LSSATRSAAASMLSVTGDDLVWVAMRLPFGLIEATALAS